MMYGFLHAVIAVTAGVVLFRLCMSISSYIWAIVFVLPLFLLSNVRWMFTCTPKWYNFNLVARGSKSTTSLYLWRLQNKFIHCTLGDSFLCWVLFARTTQFASSGSSLHLCHRGRGQRASFMAPTKTHADGHWGISSFLSFLLAASQQQFLH